MRVLPLTLMTCALALPAYAQYSGGRGEPNDPYQIATAADLIALGETPDDYDKHFILTADIDLSGCVFDRAVMAPDANDAEDGVQGNAFTGVFDGSGHVISHLTIAGGSYVGLFGLARGAEIYNLGLEAVDVNGAGYVGGLVGSGGHLTDCHSAGTVSGDSHVGGLAGTASSLTDCYSMAEVSGAEYVGGLVGEAAYALRCHNVGAVSGDTSVGGLAGHIRDSSTVVYCYNAGVVSGGTDVGGLAGSTYCDGQVLRCHNSGTVTGHTNVGGLVGRNGGGWESGLGDWAPGTTIEDCYSDGPIIGVVNTGGLVGWNSWTIMDCYAVGTVTGSSAVGGLVGCNARGEERPARSLVTRIFNGAIGNCYFGGTIAGSEQVGGLVGRNEGGLSASLWNRELSGVESMCGTQADDGVGCDDSCGKTTSQMQAMATFIEAGWDFANEASNGTADIWWIAEGENYPRLWWERSPESGLPSFSGGTGEPDAPYLISTAEQLQCIGRDPRLMESHFKIVNDLDLQDIEFRPIGDQYDPYSGTFDGDGHALERLTIRGDVGGIFRLLGARGEIRDLSIVDVNVVGSSENTGGLLGLNDGGVVARCDCTGWVTGGERVGGLVGSNQGSIRYCQSTVVVSGYTEVGGLLGNNGSWQTAGVVSHCSSGSTVSGHEFVGGLAGRNNGSITISYSTGAVTGDLRIGGLVGSNSGSVAASCSSGAAVGEHYVGGLAGSNNGSIVDSYSSAAATAESVAGGLVGDNRRGTISDSYSVGPVNNGGDTNAGGLLAWNHWALGGTGTVTGSFWDIVTSGQTTSGGGTGLTTPEMQTAATFLEAGWDFIDETDNGTDDIWWILEGQDYPRLWWQLEEAPLPAAEVIELDDVNFDGTIAQGVVLVDFYATWCSHCRTQAPILEEVVEQVRGEAVVAKLDIDQARSIAQRYGVTAIPTLILFKNGEVVERFVGVTQAAVLTAAIHAAIAHEEPVERTSASRER